MDKRRVNQQQTIAGVITRSQAAKAKTTQQEVVSRTGEG